MPPAKKFQKDDIINATYEIVAKEGFACVNARRIAAELKCSVQPIFHNFSTMEELKCAVYEKIHNTYKEYILSGITMDKPYKAMGLSYIKFAMDYPEFFKILFMQKTDLDAEKFVMADAMGDEVIKNGQKLSGLSYEEHKKFHIKVWIFTHGIACLAATKTVGFTEEQIDALLENTVREMLIGYKKAGRL